MSLSKTVQPLAQIKPVGKTLLTLGLSSDFSLSSDGSQKEMVKSLLVRNTHSLTDIMQISVCLISKVKYTVDLLDKMDQRTIKLDQYCLKIDRKLAKISLAIEQALAASSSRQVVKQ
ncbi:hypothetical protein SS50377_20931 [Spironucleus salmonicida]|uniref:Uncharacterized protein n=1 Tax=Spironucleus salmonicida TaxID=348837 RepID=V6LS46_9EUKA|nr:hypothetical protein SS50377_20931 [Spironucleus salmonicida]|eukprot:EST43604.1 Hypothetical protein SS50377_16646 [Spironucleus salmonicida]